MTIPKGSTKSLRDHPVPDVASTWTPDGDDPTYTLHNDFTWDNNGASGVDEFNTSEEVYKVDSAGVTILLYYGLYRVDLCCRLELNGASPGVALNCAITVNGTEVVWGSTVQFPSAGFDKFNSEKTSIASAMLILDKSDVVSGHIDLCVGNTSNLTQVNLLDTGTCLTVTRIR